MTQVLDVHALARRIRAAQDEARPIEPFTAQLGGFDLSAGYEVARLNHERRLAEGSVPAGRKIGFTNPGMWAQYGVRQPIWAHVYDSTVVHARAAPAACSLARFVQPKIEPEIVLHFRSAPPHSGDLAAILGCVDWIAHAFEIVQCHFPGWKFEAADAVADDTLHAALWLGEPQPVDALGSDLPAALERFSVALSCDGTLRETGRGSNVLGSPLAAVAHLIEVLAQQPQSRPLQAGEMVTTGTVTAALPVRAGETWSTALDGIALPGLSLAFVA